MVINTIINEENKNVNKLNVLSVNNFENVMSHANKNEGVNLNQVLESEDTIISNTNLESDDLGSDSLESQNLKPNHLEIIGEDDVEEIQSLTKTSTLLEGGKRKDAKDAKDAINNDNDSDGHSKIISENETENDKIIYTIEYILEDDEKLINPDKVYQNVDKYINNYNSDKIKKYKNEFKQLYQTYSNKNYIIETKKFTTTYKITVIKNDKSKKIVKELIKPLYMFYNEDSNLLKMKRNISNSRSELLYKYEIITSKLNITPEEKKEFEKERSKFIEMLEDYYTYTLYHKKINKIITINKSSLVLQKEMSVYKENNDNENKILNSNIYTIDNTIIETINKYNSDNLISFNNIMLTLSGKKDNEKDKNSKDKKTIETIKSYLKEKQEIESFTKKISKNTDIQDEYINYIIMELPQHYNNK